MRRGQMKSYEPERLEFNDWEGYGTPDNPAPTASHISLRQSLSNSLPPIREASPIRLNKHNPPKRNTNPNSAARRMLERQRDQLRSALSSVETVLAMLR